MTEFYMLPPMPELKEIAKVMPDYMRPNRIPHAVVKQAHLDQAQCKAISDFCMKEESYRFPVCSAETREAPRPLDEVFDPIKEFVLMMNASLWKFNLDSEPACWMQTYKTGNKYSIHMDGVPGQSRKLTAVVMLTDPNEYTGGQLRLVPYPNAYNIPKDQGTIVVYPSWILHDVSVIESGVRQTLNVGYWGPPFR